MADQVTNYQCPNCTGPLRYDGRTGKLQCDFCGSSFDVSEIEALYAEKEKKAAAAKAAAEAAGDEENGRWDYSGLSQDWGEDAAKMRSYNCPSCGAELICEESTGATSCPYCGNPTVVSGQFAGMLRPEYVIPFSMEKDDAIKALKKHYKGKYFLPKNFTDGNHLDKIQGVYVPFWMFDGRAEGGASFEATKVKVVKTDKEEITRTEYYEVRREGNVSFEKVPVDASGKMQDDYMNSIEPYDYSGLTKFSSAYLPGFLADKYDVTAEDCATRADDRCKETLLRALEGTVKEYNSTRMTTENVVLQRGGVHYALLPVWVLNTKWEGRDFLFVMNGQTGKMAGDLPISRSKFWSTLGLMAGALTAVMWLIYFLV